MSDLSLLKLLLPEYLVDYFDVLRHESHDEQLHLYFEEKNKAPIEYAKISLAPRAFIKR